MSLQAINSKINEREYIKAIQECNINNEKYLSSILQIVYNVPTEIFPDLTSKDMIKIKILCDWTSNHQIREDYNRLSKGNYTWNNIKMVTENEDYTIIINSTKEKFEPKKSILLRMEPLMETHTWRGFWANPPENYFLHICFHKNEHNNLEWHLSKTYTQLSTMTITKNPELDNVVSCVLSEKYFDPGHIRRIDFVKFAEKQHPFHVFGSNRWNYINYKGSLPYLMKDNGIFPYKYHFNVENHSYDNNFTEKIVDAILGECLIFYNGCTNIEKFIDERAFVKLSLSNFPQDLETIQRAIREDWHSQRLPYIREAKKKILNEYQFFPRIEKLLTSI
jgi:hypothetical protein